MSGSMLTGFGVPQIRRLPGRVVGAKQPAQPVPLPVGQRPAIADQQLPVGPGVVADPATVAVHLITA
jgi:hypothetical protein